MYVRVLNRVLGQKLRFCKGKQPTCPFVLDPAKLALPRIMGIVFRNCILNYRVLDGSNKKLNMGLLALFQNLKEFVGNYQLFINQSMPARENVVDFFGGLFSVLKSHSTYFFFCEVSSILQVYPGPFFLHLFLDMLNALWFFKAQKSSSMLTTARLAFVYLRSHLESSQSIPELERVVLDAESIKQMALFIQHFVKVGILKIRLAGLILSMLSSLLDVMTCFLTQKLFTENTGVSLVEYRFLATHLTQYVKLLKNRKT